ncbi:hypothetical protein, partial [Vibrio mediterranei]|uniref:hypothetical protein n=1 Tax=Vibrio mediterranei TaxID=689 RepID=UPI0040690789
CKPRSVANRVRKLSKKSVLLDLTSTRRHHQHEKREPVFDATVDYHQLFDLLYLYSSYQETPLPPILGLA